jgi:hypothetical protein
MEGPRNLDAIEACPSSRDENGGRAQGSATTNHPLAITTTSTVTPPFDLVLRHFPGPSTAPVSLRNLPTSTSLYILRISQAQVYSTIAVASPPTMSTADELKAQGNAAIAAKNFDEAV